MNVFSYAWSLSVTWQRWRSHKSIRQSRKPCAARTIHGSMCHWNKVIADRSFTLRERELSTFLAPVTLTLTRWPSYTNLIRIPWRCIGCAKMNSLRQGFRKLSSDRHMHRAGLTNSGGPYQRKAGALFSYAKPAFSLGVHFSSPKKLTTFWSSYNA